MTLPVVIPNEFANATASIPLSQLDSNFSTLANVVNEINAGTQQLSNANVVTLIVTGNATIGDASSDTVTLNSTLTANTAVIFSAGTSAAPAITTTGDTNTGIFFPAADTIAFAEGSAEAMRITSAGEVLVGGTTAISAASGCLTLQRPDATPQLSLYRNDTTISSGNVLGAISWVGNDTTSNTPTEHAYIAAFASGTHAAGDNPTDLVFGTTPDGTETVAEAGRITQSGAYVLKGGTTTAAAGVGIVFPATQVASADVNCLDDYEEGTWTPTYVPVTGAFTTITYDPLTTGRYTKIGNTVYIQAMIRTDAITVGTASNGVRLGSLPFTQINANPVCAFTVGYAAFFAGDMPSGSTGRPNETAVDLLYRTTANGGSLTLDVTDLGTGTNANYIIFEGFYTVA